MLEGINITYAYKGKTPILNSVSISLAREERLYLSAPSGAGKTTLCRILAGYEQPQAGQVFIDGKPLPRSGVCPVQMIGQHPEQTLDPRKRMQDSLAEAGEADPMLFKRLGIQKQWLSRFPHELSGGEMQRFCIARALMAHPRYLIADEISTMLDAVTQKQIWKILLEECKMRNMGLLFTTHSTALAQHLMTRQIALV